MQCSIHPLNSLVEYRYVAIFSAYGDKLLFSRHKDRDTWETQGGHIEPGETPYQAACRELWEESGAEEFILTPLCDYHASDETSNANGVVFLAQITRLGKLPLCEMAEISLFDTLPDKLTYPDITPLLYDFWQKVSVKA